MREHSTSLGNPEWGLISVVRYIQAILTQFKPVFNKVATLGMPEYLPSKYRTPDTTFKATASSFCTSVGVMFCQSAKVPAGV